MTGASAEGSAGDTGRMLSLGLLVAIATAICAHVVGDPDGAGSLTTAIYAIPASVAAWLVTEPLRRYLLSLATMARDDG